MRRRQSPPAGAGLADVFAWWQPGDPPPAGCWDWRGPISGNGYGKLTSGKQYYAHRVAHELFVGPIPDGHVVRHSCDRPHCVQPAHLSYGTQRDNVDDALSRGRIRRGERHGRAKLTEAQVAEIRYRYESGGITQQQLADQFGVNNQMISRIVRRKNWS